MNRCQQGQTVAKLKRFLKDYLSSSVASLLKIVAYNLVVFNIEAVGALNKDPNIDNV